MADRSRNVIYQTTTNLETYEVVEEVYADRYSRLLYSGQVKTAQSGIPLDNSDLMLFEYCQRLVELVMDLQPKDVLMIGGGAFTLPTHLIKTNKNIQFDVIEPDKDLEVIAKQYFELEVSKQINVINDFGLHYLKNSKKKYDLIILDAYYEDSIPKEFLSRKFAKLAVSSLKEHGVLAANVVSTLRMDAKVLEMHNIYRKYFKYSRLYPTTKDRTYYYAHNIIYVASLEPENFLLKYPALRQLEA